SSPRAARSPPAVWVSAPLPVAGRAGERPDSPRSAEPALFDLTLRLVGLLEILDAQLALDAVRPLELDVAVADPLEAVAPGVAEVEAPARVGDDRDALALGRRARRCDVVDDEAEVPVVIGRLCSRLGDRQELVAHV